MLVLFETPAGYAVFKLLDEKKLKSTDDLFKDFQTAESASKVVKLKEFKKFKDTTEALAATCAAVEGKMSKTLKKVLKKLYSEDLHEQLAVADAKLGNSIKDKLSIPCVANSAINELIRGIRSQMDSLITGLPQKEMAAMALGLAHSLSRYKLKFSPEKVDTMIVQAISLLDDLDKELNNYVMRCREWYGWHFPELGKIITDNTAYAKCLKLMGDKVNCATTDFSSILPEEVEAEVKEAAEISMGTEVSEEDMTNVLYLCDQILEISEYRGQLYDYLKNRMLAIAPNLTVLVGELVGARLISHAGSLVNLAKHPASTVQILGAEKALFRALKTKHDTPKYGLIYHASLVGQSATKNKGKMSRMLAAKAALATRVDALGDEATNELGIEHRAKLEGRLRMLEEGGSRRISGTGKQVAKFEKYENKSEIKTYNAGADSTLSSKKRKADDTEATPTHKKIKVQADGIVEEGGSEKKKKKKKNKEKADDSVADSTLNTTTEETETPKKKKKKSKKAEADESTADTTMDTTGGELNDTTDGEKKKKKKKKKDKKE
ncbi:unnamed protein product [Owenia fusiformis]|uniref:Nucleolar protein 58 n=1 Tax=Owenia fusiformis TaxID=6347 RepID=A0A8J1ULA6_OWEFU|nr:unnamed protein product [Owenia fusiformis]